jgi:ribosome-associated protein
LTFAPNAPGAWEGTVALVGDQSAERAQDRWTVAARAASSKLGRDTVVLDVENLLGLTDAFVITSGANPRQVRTICDEVQRQLKLDGTGRPLWVEGLDDARWALLDYGDFVVHVFLEEARLFYDLEQLWGDAPRWAWDERAETLLRVRN